MSNVIRVDDRARSFTDTLSAATAGEYWALESLAAECIPELTAFAEVRGAVEPDGIANTVMMEFFARLDGLAFEAPAQMWAYLYRIARSRIVDERRAAKPVEYRERESMEGLLAPSSEFDDQVADRHYVDRLLSELTTEQREVLEMRFLDDLSIEETASRTGRTLTAVKGLQRRAIKALSTAAVIFGVLVFAGTVWLIVDREPSAVTTVSDSPPATVIVDVSPTDPTAPEDPGGPIDGGAVVGPGDYLAPSTVITDLSIAEDDPRSVTFEFEAEDELSGVAGFECRLDGGDYTPCTSPHSYQDLANGSHVFEVRSFDRADNTEATPATMVWTVEIAEPEATEPETKQPEATEPEATERRQETVPGVDVDVLRRSDAELKCGGVAGSWAEIEALGYDVMVGTDGDDVIDVSAGDKPDFVLSYGGNDSVKTGPGDDLVCAGGGNDTVETGRGHDRVAGNSGNDTIMTGPGDDKVRAGSGNDSVHGGSGADLLKGDRGIDTLDGGDGDDRLEGNDDLDVLVGGKGQDVCDHGGRDGHNDSSCEQTP